MHLGEMTPGSDDENRRFFEELYESGELLEGVGEFGEGDVKGIGNGLFSVTLRVNEELPEQLDGVSRDSTPLWWCKGRVRMDRATDVCKACIHAGIPLVLESDAPDESVMGVAALDALDRGYDGLGKVGGGSIYLTQAISKDFVRSWVAGGAKEDCLRYPWTIQDLEVRLNAQI